MVSQKVRKHITYTFSENIFSERLYPETHNNVYQQTIYSTHLIYHLMIMRQLHLRLSRDDLTSNGSLHRNLKHLPWNWVFQAFTHGFSWFVRTVSADQKVPIRDNRWRIEKGTLWLSLKFMYHELQLFIFSCVRACVHSLIFKWDLDISFQQVAVLSLEVFTESKK